MAYRGYVWKRGGANPAFKKRWVVVTEFGRVIYFPEVTSTKPSGQFSLQGTVVEILDMEEAEFVLKTPARDWIFKVEDENNMVAWVNTLNRVAADEFTTSSTGADEDALKLIRGPQAGWENKMKLDARESSFVLDVSRARSSGTYDVKQLPMNVDVACLTWNLAEKLPNMDDLSVLKTLRDCHFLVIGVQECQSVMAGTEKNQVGPASVWQAMCNSVVGKRFAGVAGKTMGPIHIDLYARSDVIAGIDDLRIGHVSCGMGNVMYNKGAVSISLKLHGKRIAFVCAHLAARTERIRERGADFCRIDANMPAALGLKPSDGVAVVGPDADVFYKCTGPPESLEVKDGTASEGGSGENLARLFDATVFFGDLNYRIEGDGAVIKNLCRCYDVLSAVEKTAEDAVRRSSVMSDIGEDDESVAVDEDQLAIIESQIDQVNLSSTEKSSAPRLEDFDEDDEDEEKDVAAQEGSRRKTFLRMRSSSIKKQNHIKITCLGESMTDMRALSREALLAKAVEIKEVTGFEDSLSMVQSMLDDDQLGMEKKLGRVLRGFHEGPITFKPSYKFDPGEPTWDSGKKDRAPAWCDRVFVSSRKDVPIEIIKYVCYHKLMHSDHRPVLCRMQISFPEADETSCTNDKTTEGTKSDTVAPL